MQNTWLSTTNSLYRNITTNRNSIMHKESLIGLKWKKALLNSGICLKRVPKYISVEYFTLGNFWIENDGLPQNLLMQLSFIKQSR